MARKRSRRNAKRRRQRWVRNRRPRWLRIRDRLHRYEGWLDRVHVIQTKPQRTHWIDTVQRGGKTQRMREMVREIELEGGSVIVVGENTPRGRLYSSQPPPEQPW